MIKEFHPSAEIFPLLEGPDFEALVEDIRDHGLREPIFLHTDGRILDGRNRYRACELLGITPPHRIWSARNGETETAFVVSMNLHRRHLNAFQRIELVLRLKDKLLQKGKENQKWHGETAPGRKKSLSTTLSKVIDTRKEVARLAGASEGTSNKSEFIINNADAETKQSLRAGKKTINSAYLETKNKIKTEKRDKERKQIAKKIKDIDLKEFIHGDFREVAKTIPDGSVDLIFTDPPYDLKSRSLYGDLAVMAQKKLVKGGSLVVYGGQLDLPGTLDWIVPHLRYWWTLSINMTGRAHTHMNEYGVIVKWKALLWFVKGTRGNKETFVEDLVESKKEKSFHPWQQGIQEALYYIEKLVPKDGFVFDPFCGGGTTAFACKELKRRVLTCDIDDDSLKIAKERFMKDD